MKQHYEDWLNKNYNNLNVIYNLVKTNSKINQDNILDLCNKQQFFLFIYKNTKHYI